MGWILAGQQRFSLSVHSHIFLSPPSIIAISHCYQPFFFFFYCVSNWPRMPFADRWKSESLAETGQDPFWVLFIAWKVSKEVGGSFPVHEKDVWPSKNEEYEEGEEYQPTENSCLNVCVWEDSVEASHCWKRMFVKWLTLEERLLAKDMEDAGCLLTGKGCRKDGTSKSLAEDRFNLHLVLFLLFLSLPMWYGKSTLTSV